MTALILPPDPDGSQYEDLLAATLRSLGYFVETGLTLKDDNKEVLELDVVATPVGRGADARVLFEAKKESFSFSNFFKVYGQRHYLGIGTAVLVSLRGAESSYVGVYEAKGKELGVRPCHYPLRCDPLELAEAHNAIQADVRAALVTAGWYQEIGRRLAGSDLRRECKIRGDVEFFTGAKRYVFNVRASFFQKSPLARAEALYGAYFDHPKLTGAAISLLASENGLNGKAVLNSLTDSDKWLWAQAIMHTEGCARVAILKNALDDFLERGQSPPPTSTLRRGDRSLDVPLHALPASFYQGLARLREHPHGVRLPYLFQVFSETLGGFLHQDDAEELALLETLTGVPSAEVVPLLRLFDSFFGLEKTMFREQPGRLLCLKLTPAFCLGGGAFLRSKVFKFDDYRTRYPQTGWLLQKWHNALYRVLEPALPKESAQS